MKIIVPLCIWVWLLISSASAQLLGRVEVVADARLEKMEESFIKSNKRDQESDGFRIQVAQSSERASILKMQVDLIKKYPNIPWYVEFQQPYFRLRAGNFRNRFEALGPWNVLKKDFPQSYLVSDQVDLLLDPESPEELRQNDSSDHD
jgi:hypothetical protein